MNLKSLMKKCRTKKSFIVPGPEKSSGKEYEHVLNVWNEFEMKTVKGYNNLCSKYDVLLLVDVSGNFYI